MDRPTVVASGSSHRFVGVARSARVVTRIWFDLLAPSAMVLVVTGGQPSALPFIGALAMLVLFHAGHTYFNDVTDIEVDRSASDTDRSQRALVSNNARREDMLLAGVALSVASLVIAALLSWTTLALMVIVTILVLCYNFPPVRLSGRPLATQVFWPVIWILMYAILTITTGGDHWREGLPLLAFVVLFMGLGESITQDVRDAPNDAAGGRRTTVVQYGVAKTTLVAWGCQALSLVPLALLAAWSRVPWWAVALAAVAVVIWLVRFAVVAARLRTRFDAAEARLSHVGSIYAFTAVNAAVVIGMVVAQ